ncbi:MAG: HYR domain-containing protein, partial [Opitutaceae bacterium]|nr:HYR domain-containing protein [Verrucomicrobiales bacterium]
MKINLRPILLLIGLFSCLLSGSVRADLLGVAPGYPRVGFISQSPTAVSYDPGSHILTVNADPIDIVDSPLDGGVLIVSNRSVQIVLNNSGGMVSGTGGFTLTGEFTRTEGGMPVTYSGVLLTGDVTAFGYLDSAFVDQYDFRVNLTGGQIVSLFNCGSSLAIELTSEASTFQGNFEQEFHGTAKGSLGPEDLTPPTITCPPTFQIVTTPATGPSGEAGFIITYPDPLVTDTCDPQPSIFCDVPSGTFLPLLPGETVTVTCYGIDAAGNYDFCSFTATMAPPGGGPIYFPDGDCGLTTLNNDLGNCSATYTFALPIATNSSGQTFVATATAVDETGVPIPLIDLGNGTVRGIFPRTTTGSNVVTFVATDGNGNSVIRQCPVLVKDVEAPTLLCLNQTGTFKPILTNALSCISGEFGGSKITGDKAIWFSSVLNTPSGSGTFTVRFYDQTINLDDDDTNIVINVPEAMVTFSNGVQIATTTFVNGKWVTVARRNGND